MADLFENPIGTDGFEFVEYTSSNPEELAALFERLGFTA
ncbi:MAG: 4-hydroxyphenylpyruvate dioxygenase, partial [Pseudomonadota bacterium]